MARCPPGRARGVANGLWLALWWPWPGQTEVRQDSASQFEGLVAGAVEYGSSGLEVALRGEGSGTYESGKPVMPPEGNRPTGINHDGVGRSVANWQPGRIAVCRA